MTSQVRTRDVQASPTSWCFSQAPKIGGACAPKRIAHPRPRAGFIYRHWDRQGRLAKWGRHRGWGFGHRVSRRGK